MSLTEIFQLLSHLLTIWSLSTPVALTSIDLIIALLISQYVQFSVKDCLVMLSHITNQFGCATET